MEGKWNEIVRSLKASKSLAKVTILLLPELTFMIYPSLAHHTSHSNTSSKFEMNGKMDFKDIVKMFNEKVDHDIIKNCLEKYMDSSHHTKSQIVYNHSEQEMNEDVQSKEFDDLKTRINTEWNKKIMTINEESPKRRDRGKTVRFELPHRNQVRELLLFILWYI